MTLRRTATAAPETPAAAMRPEGRSGRLGPYAWAVVYVVAATLAAELLDAYLPFTTLNLVYLMAVLVTARQFGLWPSIFCVVLGANVYNFFFIPPRLHFEIANPADFAGLIFFAVVAIVVSNLTAQSRRQMQQIGEHARTTEELYAFSRKITGIGAVDALLPVVAYRIAGMFKCNVTIMLPSPGGLKVHTAYPPERQLDDRDLAVALRCFVSAQAQLREPDDPGEVARLFVPMRTGRGAAGVVAVDRPELQRLEGDERQLLDAVVDQTTVAMERIRLAEDVEGARRAAATERLRNALLTSISHDLRTPLAGIIGALTSLTKSGATYDAGATAALTGVALEEAERLDRFVGNLLDMARLEAGGIRVRIEPTDLADVVSEAIRHAGSLLSERRLVVDLPDDLPLVMADGVLLERVVFNLLDNAAKYSAATSTIEIVAYASGSEVVIEFKDEGRGLSAQAGTLFHTASRDEGAERPTSSGLGLAICRGFLKEMSGSIDGADRSDRRGAVFTLRLPRAVVEMEPEP